MGNLVTIARALRKVANKEPEPDYRNLPNELGYTYPIAGEEGAHPKVREAIDEFHSLPETAKRDLPLLWYLLGEGGTPPYKMSKADSDYTDESPYQATCANCSFAYLRVVPDVLICSQIRGELDSQGWCRLWEPYPEDVKEAWALTKRLASAQSGLRLLLLADQLTINPRILRQIQNKIKEQGAEALSPRERKILQQLERQNRLRQEGSDVESARQELQEYERLKNELEAPGTSEERRELIRKQLPGLEEGIAEKKKLVEEKGEREGIEEDPSEINVPAKMREALEKAGIDVDELSYEEAIQLHKKVLEKDPFASTQPVKKSIGSAKKLKSRMMAMSRRIPADLKELSQSGEGGQLAAKRLNPVVQELMSPVEGMVSRITRLESILTSLDEQFSPEKLRAAQQLFAESEPELRQLGSQINESLGPMRNKHQEASQNLKQVLDTRLNAAVQQFQERGATPDQAAEAAQSHPVIRKLRTQAESMKAIAWGIDFILREFGSRYAAVLKDLRQLKSDLSGLRTEKAAHFRALVKILASFSVRKGPQDSRISKKIRRATKRLGFLQYLSATS